MPKSLVFKGTEFTPAEYAMYVQLRAIRRAVEVIGAVIVLGPLVWLLLWLAVR